MQSAMRISEENQDKEILALKEEIDRWKLKLKAEKMAHESEIEKQVGEWKRKYNFVRSNLIDIHHLAEEESSANEAI